MYSDSMVEIGMTALAWSHYNYYLGLIASIGILAIPFFVMIYNNHQETRRSQNAMAASLAESRRTSSDVIMMVVVAALFIVPMQATSINPGQWTNQLQIKQAGIQDADNDEFIVDTNNSIPVPPAWYFITHISKAIVNAYKDIASLDQLDADNLNLMRGFVTAKVADHLKTELEAFVNHCYIPVGKKAASIGKVFNSDTSRSHLDLSYIGNQHYLLGKGLYQYCSESECEFSMAHTEYNMPYEFASRITPKFDLIQNVTLPDGTTTTQTILPSCYVWWVGRGDSVYPAGDLGFSASRIPNDHLGLRDQLFISSDFGQGAVDRVNVFNDLSLSARDRFNDSRYRDAVVHRALINTYEGRLTTRTRATDADRSTTDKVLDLAGLTAAGGLASLGYVFSKILYMALPPFLEITHALLKLVVIFGSMIVILIGGMNITVALKTTIYVMTVYSFEILWHILDTIKAKLIPYIYGVSSISDVPSPGLLPGAGGSLLGHAIFEIVMVLSYLVIPGVFVAYLAVAGGRTIAHFGGQNDGSKMTQGKRF